MNKCVICRFGELETGHTTLMLERDEKVVVIQHVPAQVCYACGEGFTNQEVSVRVGEMADKAMKKGLKIQLLDYESQNKQLGATTMTQQFLRGQVIRILDDQRLLINIGAEQGLSHGDRLCVYDPGEEIKDPNSGEILGQLEIIKATVEAVHVQEKMTLVMPLQRDQPTGSTVLSATLAAIPAHGKGDYYRDRLNVRTDQINGVSTTAPIVVGNAVRTIERVEQ